MADSFGQLGSVSVAVIADLAGLRPGFDAGKPVAEKYGTQLGKIFSGEFSKALGNFNLKQFQASLQSVADKSKSIGTTLTASLTLPLTALGTAAFASSVKIDEAMDQIRAGTGATGKALEDLGADFKKVLGEVPNSVGDVSSAITELHQRTGSTGPALQDLATQLLNVSRLTKTEVSTNIKDSTRLFEAWGVATQDQAADLDFLFKTSQRTNIGFSRLNELLVEFKVPLQQLGFGFKESAALLGQFEKSGVNTEQALSAMGRALSNLSKAGAKDAGAALGEIIRRIKDLDSQAANAIGLKVFGERAGKELVDAIRKGRLEVGELVKTLDSSAETINKAAEDTLSFTDKIARFGNKMLTALSPVGDAITKAMEAWIPAAEHGVEILADLIKKFSDLPQWIQAVSLAGVGLAAAAGPAFFGIGLAAGAASEAVLGLSKLSAAASAIAKAFGVGAVTQTAGEIAYLGLAGEKAAGHMSTLELIGSKIGPLLEGLGGIASKIAGPLTLVGLAFAGWKLENVIIDLLGLRKPFDDAKAAAEDLATSVLHLGDSFAHFAVNQIVGELKNFKVVVETMLGPFKELAKAARDIAFAIVLTQLVRSGNEFRSLAGIMNDLSAAMDGTTKSTSPLTAAMARVKTAADMASKNDLAAAMARVKAASDSAESGTKSFSDRLKELAASGAISAADLAAVNKALAEHDGAETKAAAAARQHAEDAARLNEEIERQRAVITGIVKPTDEFVHALHALDDEGKLDAATVLRLKDELNKLQDATDPLIVKLREELKLHELIANANSEEADATEQLTKVKRESLVTPRIPPKLPQVPDLSGMITPGNIDLFSRPQVKNLDDTVSTVRSISVEIEGLGEVLIPTVSETGKLLTDLEAIQQFKDTGKHLGIFVDAESATKAALAIHDQQAALLALNDVPPPSFDPHHAFAADVDEVKKKVEDAEKTIASMQGLPANVFSSIKQLTALVDENGQRVYSDKTIIAALGDEIENAAKVAKELGIPLDENTKILVRQVEATKAAQKAAEDWRRAWATAVGNIVSKFSDGVTDMIFSGKEFSVKLKSIFTDLGKSLIKILVTDAFGFIAKQFSSLIGGLFSGKGGMGGLLSNLGGGALSKALPGLLGIGAAGAATFGGAAAGTVLTAGPAAGLAIASAPTAVGGIAGGGAAAATGGATFLGMSVATAIPVIGGAIAAALVASHYIGQGRRTANEFVQGAQNPFGENLGKIVDAFNEAVAAGKITSDQAAEAKDEVTKLWSTFRTEADKFAAQGATQAKVVRQAYETLDPLIAQITKDMDASIESIKQKEAVAYKETLKTQVQDQHDAIDMLRKEIDYIRTDPSFDQKDPVVQRLLEELTGQLDDLTGVVKSNAKTTPSNQQSVLEELQARRDQIKNLTEQIAFLKKIAKGDPVAQKLLGELNSQLASATASAEAERTSKAQPISLQMLRDAEDAAYAKGFGVGQNAYVQRLPQSLKTMGDAGKNAPAPTSPLQVSVTSSYSPTLTPTITVNGKELTTLDIRNQIIPEIFGLLQTGGRGYQQELVELVANRLKGVTSKQSITGI